MNVQELVDGAEHPSVTREILEATRSDGGLFGQDGVKTHEPPVKYLSEGEQPHYAFQENGKSPELNGTKIKNGMGIGTVLITDRRSLAIIPKDGEDKVISIPHHDVNDADVKSGLLLNALIIKFGDDSKVKVQIDAKNAKELGQRVAGYILNKRVESEEKENSPDGPDSASHTVNEPSDYLADEDRGEFVKEKKISKIMDVLDDGEVVHYMTEGGTIDVEGSSAGTSLFGDDRSRKIGTKDNVRAAITDKRVVVKIPQHLGDDERSVPYDSITSVDLDTGIVNKRLTLQTPGQTYHIGCQAPGKDECKRATQFIRDMIAKTNEPDTVVQESSEPDPTEQLKNLKELYDDGVITDEEFEEKKQSLLDDI